MGLLIIYGIIAVVIGGGGLMYCFFEMEEEKIPSAIAAGVLWPLALAFVVFLGIKQAFPERTGLSRKQQRQIDYQRQLNDELERNMRIINGTPRSIEG